jgi:DUF4097 and DUF4098 domain-containing protein YvlB
MESRNRGLWIFIVVALLGLCCCVLVMVAAALGVFGVLPVDLGGLTTSESARLERTFEVGESPSLQIDNFAGSVTVVAGARGEISVVAVKKASPGANLDRIEVQITERQGGLVIQTKKPATLGNASVNLEVMTPDDTRLDVHNGAGSVSVQGLHSEVQVDTGTGSVHLHNVSGQIDAHSGAGSIEVQDAEGTLKVDTGTGSVTLTVVAGEIDAHSGAGSIKVRDGRGQDVRLDTGSGSVDYDGSLQGDCRFESGAGSITLRLPADLNMNVEMHTGAGTIEVGFPVDGRVTKREVEGTIGSGADGLIYAHTGTGGIDLVRR